MPLFVVHTGGWNPPGNGLGAGTEERLEKTLADWKKLPVISFIFIPSGSRAPATGELMCVKAREWFLRNGVPAHQVLIPENPTADNSIAEVIEAVRFIRKMG